MNSCLEQSSPLPSSASQHPLPPLHCWDRAVQIRTIPWGAGRAKAKSSQSRCPPAHPALLGKGCVRLTPHKGPEPQNQRHPQMKAQTTVTKSIQRLFLPTVTRPWLQFLQQKVHPLQSAAFLLQRKVLSKPSGASRPSPVGPSPTPEEFNTSHHPLGLETPQPEEPDGDIWIQLVPHICSESQPGLGLLQLHTWPGAAKARVPQNILSSLDFPIVLLLTPRAKSLH